MRPDPDATPEGKVARLEKDLAALSTLIQEQESEIARLRRQAIHARSKLWYSLGRALRQLPDLSPGTRNPPGS